MLRRRLVERLLYRPVEMLVCSSSCAADSVEFSPGRLDDVSMHPARGGGAVGVTSWVWAMAVSTPGFMRTIVSIEPLVSVCAFPTVPAAGYSSAAGGVAVLLAAWVVSLYRRVFTDFFRELAGAKELECANWLLVGYNPGRQTILIGPVA